jgi:hypothetical protein
LKQQTCEHVGGLEKWKHSGVTMEILTQYDLSTLWLFNIAMENGTFIDDFPS